MELDTVTIASAATPGPPAADDPRGLFAIAVATTGRLIDGVRSTQLADPTPCDEFSVGALLDHLVMVLERVAIVGSGGSVAQTGDDFGRPTDPDHATAWSNAAEWVRQVWTDDAVLDRVIALPWATMPGRITLLMYINEVTVHGWDLATATGQHGAWDDDVAEAALGMMGIALPSDIRTPPVADRVDGGQAVVVPFGPVVEVPPTASAIDRLVAWNGRRP